MTEDPTKAQLVWGLEQLKDIIIFGAVERLDLKAITRSQTPNTRPKFIASHKTRRLPIPVAKSLDQAVAKVNQAALFAPQAFQLAVLTENQLLDIHEEIFELRQTLKGIRQREESPGSD